MRLSLISRILSKMGKFDLKKWLLTPNSSTAKTCEDYRQDETFGITVVIIVRIFGQFLSVAHTSALFKSSNLHSCTFFWQITKPILYKYHIFSPKYGPGVNSINQLLGPKIQIFFKFFGKVWFSLESECTINKLFVFMVKSQKCLSATYPYSSIA